MKKLLFALLFSFVTACGFAADSTISGLANLGAAPDPADEVHLSDGGAASKALTISNLFGAATDLEAGGALSADVVAAAEMADADHGDVSWTGGVASVEAGVATSGDSATAFFPAGVLETARAGLGLDVSGIQDGGMLVGTGANAFGIRAAFLTGGAAGFIKQELGGLEFDSSGIQDGGMLVGTGAGTIGIRTGVFTGGAAGFLTHDTGGLEADVNAYSGLVAISGGATSEVDSKTELETQIADVADFAEADGDTYTGTHNYGGADDLEVPNGAAPTVDTEGQIATDSTDGQFIYYSNSAVRVINPVHPGSFVIENLSATDDNLSLGMWNDAVTITGIGVHCDGTCTTPADIDLSDRAGNAMTHGAPTVSTTTGNTTFTTVTAANSLVAGEGLEFSVANAVSPETDTYTISITYTFDRQ